FDNVRRETRSFAPKLDLFAAGSLRRISRRNPLLFDLLTPLHSSLISPPAVFFSLVRGFRCYD
ncbi:unnamed protein product, partial [Arabidopsis halleri]